MNHTSDIRAAGINWKRGAFRLWSIASALWCAAVFFVVLMTKQVSLSYVDASTTVHVRISNTETWDYPAEWGVQRIRDDLRKRLAAEDEKDREWAAQVPAARKAECRAIPPTTPFADQPPDCVRLFFVNDPRAVPSDWESQIGTAPVSAWDVIAVAVPWSIGAPLMVFALGASLFWAFAGFKRGSP
jgi:hypothetical protein